MRVPAPTGSSRNRTRVLCVDDNPDMTSVTQMMIDADPAMRCVGCLTSADVLLDRLRPAADRPDVVLLDGAMPGTDPLEAMRAMAAEFPEVRTIVLSGYHDEASVARAREAGAWGYVSKAAEPDEILHAVREVAAGRACWP